MHKKTILRDSILENPIPDNENSNLLPNTFYAILLNYNFPLFTFLYNDLIFVFLDKKKLISVDY